MRQVVNGKLYDTKTAECLYGSGSGHPGDGDYSHAAVYRTPNGTLFFYRESASAYDRANLQPRIEPCSEEEAARWLEAHGGTEALLEHFSAVLEEAL